MASLREVGQMLKEAREGLGLSLDDVGQRTRISSRHLMALEEGNEADLPETFYVRGFLKKYAEVVGLSPQDVADAYKTAPIHAPTAPAPRASVGPIAYYLLIALVLGGGAALAWQLQPKVTVVAEPSPSPSPTPTAKPTPSPSLKPSPAASPVAAAPTPSPSVFAEWAATDGASPEAASPSPRPTVSAAVSASPTARPTASPTPRATARPTAKPTAKPTVRPTVRPTPTAKPTPAAAQAGQKQVELFIQERAWVEVVVDGQVQFEGLLLPGTRRSFRGKNVEVTAGNAGGVRVNVNGKDRGLLGDRGVVVTTTY